MHSGISIVCFAASYALALSLEISRLFFRVSMRTAIMVGIMVAGFVAHSLYLSSEARYGFTDGAPLSSWYHGCLVVAWVLSLVYITISLRAKPSSIGLIFLPTILALVAVAQLFPKSPQLTSEASHRVWSICHGVALLLGTAAVVGGFFSGLLYILQSYRLKHKSMTSRGLRLPSLERLQRISENALVASCVLLLIGLVSGVILNLRRGADASLPWTDPVVWPSAILLVWLVVVLTFNAFYRPAREGHKVAYLTFASFLFLGFVLGILLFVDRSHSTSTVSTSLSETRVASRQSCAAPSVRGDEVVGGDRAT